MTYQAPTEDYAFLMRHVVGSEETLQRATDGALTVDDAVDVIGSAAQLAIEVLHPINPIGDRNPPVLADGIVTSAPGFREAFEKFAAGGWIGFAAPERAGGDGTPRVLGNAVSELWSAAGPAFSLCVGLTGGAIKTIDVAATDEQRATFLEPMVAGRWTGTMNLTEPQAGTDLSSITTIARRQDDGTWRVSGQKIFITWGDHDLTENIVHLVLARTPGAPDGLAGLSLFIVPKYLPDSNGAPGERNAITTVAIEHKLGIHGSPTCVLQYENATGYLLGELNHGLAGMFVMMNVSRVGIGIQGLGVADRAYQAARDYAAERVQGAVLQEPAGTPISGHPDVARLLIGMRSTIAAMRAVLVQESQWLDQHELGDSDITPLAEFISPVVKAWFSEEAVRIASDAIQVHGGMGFIEETGVAQYYRDVRIVPIYEGTTAIQANDLIGRKTIRDDGATADRLLDLIAQDAADLRSLEHPVAARTAERIERAVGHLRAATRTIVERGKTSRRDAFAASVGYLTMWGLLAGGWMLGRSLAAAVRTNDRQTDRRAVDVDFFGAHQLSRIASLAEALDAGEIR